MSQVTTHILNTTLGKPAEGVSIILYRQEAGSWIAIGNGITNQDGRISDLLARDLVLPAGPYKLKFELEAYFERFGAPAFYPLVEIVFSVSGGEHYHIPLLLNPYGYTTYRGS